MERVADRLEDAAAAALDRITEDVVVPSDHLAHRVLIEFPRASGALDVGEQQRDGACRQHDQVIRRARAGITRDGGTDHTPLVHTTSSTGGPQAPQACTRYPVVAKA